MLYSLNRFYTLANGSLEITNQQSTSASGGYSVYFDQTYDEWWQEVELKTLSDWTDQMTHGRIRLSSKPDDKLLRKNVDDSTTCKIRKILQKKARKGSEERNNEVNADQENAVLVILPVRENIMNVKKYILECIQEFCGDKITAANGKKAVFVVSVDGMSLSDVAVVVGELYDRMKHYQCEVFSGIEPGKGPITCLCLYARI